MDGRSQFRRIAKWVGLVVCTATLILWVAGSKLDFSYSRRGWTLGLSKGMLRYREYPLWYVPPLGAHLSVYGSFNMGFRAPEVSRRFNTYVLMPMWLPFVATVVPTLLLWLPELRRIRSGVPPGHCSGCGYNLKGNESGVCSECGAKISRFRDGSQHD